MSRFLLAFTGVFGVLSSSAIAHAQMPKFTPVGVFQLPVGYTGHFSLAHDGKSLICGAETSTTILSLPSLKPSVQLPRVHTKEILDVALAPGGKFAASAGADGLAVLYELNKPRQKPIVLDDHTGDVRGVSFSPDRKFLATGSEDGLVIVRDPKTGQKIQVLTGEGRFVHSLVFSPDSALLFAGYAQWGNKAEGSISAWKTNDFRKPAWSTAKELGGVVRMVTSDDGGLLAAACLNQFVKVFDKDGAEVRVIEGHKDRVVSVAFIPKTLLLASGSWNGTVKIWDAKSGVEVTSFVAHAEGVLDVAFTTDGKLLLTRGKDKLLRAWTVPKSLK